MPESIVFSDHILASDVTFEDYMSDYAEHHAEWVEGMVIALSPVSRKHDLLTQFFAHLLRIYLTRTKVGLLMTEPFVMRVSADAPAREPDLHIVLMEHAEIVKDTMTDGPADVVIEIVSPESGSRDRGDKFDEYEAGGVLEYWLLDPQRRIPLFYHLGDDGHYHLMSLHNNQFVSRVLPHFRIPIDALWDNDVLLDDSQIRTLDDAMLKEIP